MINNDGFHKVKINATACSVAAMTIDGMPIKHIRDISVKTSLDEPTIVTVSFIADVNTDELDLVVIEDTSNDIS